jgi:hypothetical protein
MPNPLSWYFHHLPKRLHRLETLGNHVAQLVVPFGLFLPQPIAGAAGLIIVVTQCWLLLSGNFSWLNAITIVLALSAFDNRWFGPLQGLIPHTLSPLPIWFAVAVLAFTLLIALLSYWPVHNMVSRRQLMNASFNPFHLVNTYGAFGSITRQRDEIVIEGTSEPFLGPETEWKQYEFKGKPGDPLRRPPQVAPYHLRLDWLMWFAAMGSPRGYPWFFSLLIRLLENDRPTLKLLRRCPFPEKPPVFVRARLYRYRFTSGVARKETGCWWSRSLLGEYVPPVRLAPK